MRERDIEKWGNEFAKDHGFLQRKFTTPARAAAPDQLYAKAGRVFFVEYKAPGKVPGPLQAHEHKVMRSFGLTVYVADSIAAINTIFHRELALCSL